MERILILIASYRDPELMTTIESAISQAKYPERLVFGVCYQEYKGEEYERLLKIPSCRVIQVNPEDSRGCGWARKQLQTLWQGEEYALQIDSHMLFVPDWDVLAIEMLGQCPGKAILTANCPGYFLGEPVEACAASTVRADYYNRWGVLIMSFGSPILTDETVNRTGNNKRKKMRDYMSIVSKKPVRGAFWCAHFSFSSGDVIAKLPYDPVIYFQGEEISYAVRAYTHGYDLYHPHIPLCYHLYDRYYSLSHWMEHEEYFLQEALSTQRVRRLLKMEPSKEEFGEVGLGTVRTLEEFEAFSGVNFRQKTISARAFLGNYGDIAPAGGHLAFQENSDEMHQKNQKILAVTAFHHIGQNSRSNFHKSMNLYLEWFSMLCRLRNLNLVCYCDSEMQKQLPTGDYEVRDFEEEFTFWGKYMEQVRRISKDSAFREYMKEYTMLPRYSLPEYILMAHCKVNFLKRAKVQFPDFSHYVWMDFGCCRVPIDPAAVFDWSPWMDDKIHFQAFRSLEDCPEDSLKLCKVGYVIAAAIFIVPREQVDWYAAVYEDELKEMLDANVVDDDHQIMMKLARKYPEKIVLEMVEEWQDLLYEAIS